MREELKLEIDPLAFAVNMQELTREQQIADEMRSIEKPADRKSYLKTIMDLARSDEDLAKLKAKEFRELEMTKRVELESAARTQKSMTELEKAKLQAEISKRIHDNTGGWKDKVGTSLLTYGLAGIVGKVGGMIGKAIDSWNWTNTDRELLEKEIMKKESELKNRRLESERKVMTPEALKQMRMLEHEMFVLNAFRQLNPPPVSGGVTMLRASDVMRKKIVKQGIRGHSQRVKPDIKIKNPKGVVFKSDTPPKIIGGTKSEFKFN